MNTHKACLLVLFVAAFSFTTFSQSAPLLKRTTYKTDRLDFGVAGTLAVTGAPVGSIRIEGWKNREVEVTAEIEVQANTEEDLASMSAVTTFVMDESTGRIGIISVGPNDKKYLKQLGKKFSKQLQSLPFKIDYVIKVPQYCDLLIDGGRGDLTISGVEGTMKLNYLETNAKLDLLGGTTIAVFGKGSVDFAIPKASWRGRFADISLATGDMNVRLPVGINSELDATILRTGKIENTNAELIPRVRKGEFTDKSVVAKSGIGGVSLKFTVGDGSLKIMKIGG